MLVDIVTGSTQGIGRAIAESVAHHRSGSTDYALFLTGRNVARGQAAADQISKASLRVCFEPCDLSDYGSVLDFCSRIGKLLGSEDCQVGILVNNAAECPKQQELVSRPQNNGNDTCETVQIDKQFDSNVLGHHFMIKAFQDHCSSDSPTPTVNVASNWAGDLDFSDLHFRKRRCDNESAYRQSKQCDQNVDQGVE